MDCQISRRNFLGLFGAGLPVTFLADALGWPVVTIEYVNLQDYELSTINDEKTSQRRNDEG